MTFNAEHKCWVMVEGLYGSLNVEILSKEESEKVLSYVKRLHGVILKGDENENPNFRGEWWVKEHSCVSYMQRLLGLRKFFIFTPYQLFCALRKMNFTIFVDARIKTKDSQCQKLERKNLPILQREKPKQKKKLKKQVKQ
tara:strand:- start:4044 stop:4463 length:420 start_codon:yes stop_codon:yes gene_type:complete